MIRSLRLRHRRLWPILAAVVPLLVALVLLARPEPPRRQVLPEALSAPASVTEPPTVEHER